MSGESFVPCRAEAFQAAERAFGFLSGYGYGLVRSDCSQYIDARCGFELEYAKPDQSVLVIYSDMELDVRFRRAGVEASYYPIDREIFNWASGLHGAMFDWTKVKDAVEKVANDIRSNYGDILAGESSVWDRIARISREQKEALDRTWAEYELDIKRKDAEQAFKTGDYRKAISIYESLGSLTPAESKRLEIARKRG